MTARIPGVAAIMDVLAAYYGEPKRPAIRNPYRMIVHRMCGYPQSDANCDRGYAALRTAVGVTPAEILAASRAKLAGALKAGGIVPELRALRLQEVAMRVQDEFGGNLRKALKLPMREALKVFQSFPTLGRSGAEKILLYNLAAPIAAVPANCAHVPPRLGIGQAGRNWEAGYRSSQAALDAALPPGAEPRLRAYLLLKQHGQTLCKSNRPLCAGCPVQQSCRYYHSTSGA